jgi:hypothetical protein
MISLPLYPRMTDGDVDDVIAAVYAIVRIERAKGRIVNAADSLQESVVHE